VGQHISSNQLSSMTVLVDAILSKELGPEVNQPAVQSQSVSDGLFLPSSALHGAGPYLSAPSRQDSAQHLKQKIHAVELHQSASTSVVEPAVSATFDASNQSPLPTAHLCGVALSASPALHDRSSLTFSTHRRLRLGCLL